ncbi:CDP-glycerol glycerophosphotransferase family protein [Shewanella donghaensis]|uniref:CDP-glycerol glycerophosphotransferase family protein n=1 Tax=Shewanella donghaensis TaxID=238836 RepID=UPI001183B9D3|nr:CDP-glycerol glycerophosphotransferase family protein [Shewanella donghaensis]
MSQFIINSIRYVVTQVLYFFSGFFPRQHKAVMGCYKNKFADNSKYLYLHWQQKQVIRAIWISGSRITVNELSLQGYEAYHRWSLNGIYHALTAKYYIYNSYIGDINQYLAKGAIKINLWHGSPLKRIEFDINNGPLFKVYHPQNLAEKLTSASLFHQQNIAPDNMVAPSELVSKLFASAFKINEAKMLHCGNPRTDYFKKYPQADSLIDELKQLNNVETVILYAPSWRDSTALANNTSNPYLKAFDFKALSSQLVNNEQLLLLRLHPNEAYLADGFSDYDNIINISDWQDTYEIIDDVDLLITDYSSLYIDMLQTKAGIIFYQFDQLEYQTDSRQCYDYAENIPPAGVVITDFIELMSYLDTFKFSSDDPVDKKNRAELTQLYWQYQQTNAFERLDEFVNAHH